MNVLNHDGKFAQWIAQLPAAKNITNQNSGLFQKNNASDSTSLKGSASNFIKKALESNEKSQSDNQYGSNARINLREIFPSSQREYTLEDAIDYQYNKTFSINFEDVMNGTIEDIKLRPPGSAVPQEFIDNLEQNGVTVDKYDAYWSSFYISGLNDNEANLEQSVDYLASGYAVAKKNIEDHFTGEEQAAALAHLDKAFGDAIDGIAKKTAEEIGGFLDENGQKGETQKVHDSIIQAYNDRIEAYTGFIEANGDYAGLNGTKNEWLKADNSYMAGQLRKAESVEGLDGSVPQYSYSLDELGVTRTFIREIKSDSSKISFFDDEEKIGLQLAVMGLKAKVYGNFEGISDSLNNKITQAVSNLINKKVDELNTGLKGVRSSVAEPEKNADLDRDAVFSVYNSVMDSYRSTGDVSKALQDGAAFASNQHMSKAGEPPYSSLNRYGNNGSSYWKNFYENTLKYKNPLVLLMPNENGYIYKESGIDALANNWNSFISKYSDNLGTSADSDNSSLMLKSKYVSVYA